METNQVDERLLLSRDENSSTFISTNLGENKLEIITKKSPCSPSPPLLLLPETKSEDTESSEKDNYNNCDDGAGGMIKSSSLSKENSLVLIETNDSGEISLILNFIKANFPSLNVQVCSTNEAAVSTKTRNNHQDTSFPLKSTNQAKSSSRNCLSASYFSSNDTRKASSSSDRASSIDNSSLSSNSSSIDRQESKDSGFWSMSKNSFESMKSLSINDPSNHNGEQTSATNTNKPFVPNTLQIQKIEPLKRSSQHHQETNLSKQQPQQQFEQQSQPSINQIMPGLVSNQNSSQNENESSCDPTKYLISPTNVLNTTKPSLLGWKKWKKGQTWRYNSSSNVSESDNTNDTTYTTDSRPNSQNSSFVINKSTDSDTLSVNSENSYFKCGNEEHQIESNQSGGLKVSTPNPILIQTNVPHFSNSFESSKTSYITIPQPNLNNWSSTSKLDDSSISDQTNLKAQKRRGKLVRDRTIDNADESSSGYNSLNANSSNISISSSKLNETTKKLLTNDCNRFAFQKSSDNSNSNSRINDISALLSPLSGNSPFIKEELASQNAFAGGRISPPEKRFSLSSHNISEQSDSSNMDAFKKLQHQQALKSFVCNFDPEHKNLNMIVSHLLNNPSIITKELRRQFSSHKSQMISSNDTLIERGSRDSSASPGRISEAPSPSTLSAAASPISSINILASFSPRSFSSSPKQDENGTSMKHYDPNFYKDLQSKLNLKASENEENEEFPIQRNNNTSCNSNSDQNQPQHSLSVSRSHSTSRTNLNGAAIGNLYAKSHFQNQIEMTPRVGFKIEKESKHHHRHHHHHHYINSHHNYRHNQKQSNENFPISNYLPAFESMALSKTNESDINKNTTSSFDFKNATPPSTNISNNNSDPPSSPSCKIICRSNSSPSYTSSPTSSSNSSAVISTEFGHAASPLSSPSYSSLLMPYNSTANTNASSSSTTTPTSPTNNTGLNSSTGFIFKSNSCSLPITSLGNSTINNNHSSASSSHNPSPSTTPTAVNLNNSFDTHFNNFYSSNSIQSQQQHSLNEKNMINRNLMFGVKPPEIVITESKPENDQIEYENESTKKLNNLNKKKSFKVNFGNNSFDSKISSKNENYYAVESFQSSSMSMLKGAEGGFKVNQQQDQCRFMNRNSPHFGLNSNNDKEIKILTNNDNNNISNGENFYEKNSNQNNMNKIFENWKFANTMLNFSFLKGNNTNNNSANIKNLNANSLATNINTNKLGKTLKPHICTICQKRFARSDMLIRHSRLHSGIRPYRCNRCGQEFSRSDHLNTHLRTHTGEKPYACPYPKCPYAACRKDMITRHMKVHTKNKLSASFDSERLTDNIVNKSNNNNVNSSSKLVSMSSASFDYVTKHLSSNNTAASSFDFSMLTNQDFNNTSSLTNQSKSTNSLIF